LGTRKIIINFCISLAPGLRTRYKDVWKGETSRIIAKEQSPATDDGNEIPFVLRMFLIHRSISTNKAEDKKDFVRGADDTLWSKVFSFCVASPLEMDALTSENEVYRNRGSFLAASSRFICASAPPLLKYWLLVRCFRDAENERPLLCANAPTSERAIKVRSIENDGDFMMTGQFSWFILSTSK